MVKIRLRRQGAKKHPFYRLVVTDVAAPRDGRCIEEIGFYDPTRQPAAVQIDEAAALRWLRRGAQPSETARALLSKAGVLRALRAGEGSEPA
jgi:small subunit ribosomal protein S16